LGNFAVLSACRYESCEFHAIRALGEISRRIEKNFPAASHFASDTFAGRKAPRTAIYLRAPAASARL
jgi:hypothetical protein